MIGAKEECNARVAKYLGLMYQTARRYLNSHKDDVEDAVCGARLEFLERCYDGGIRDGGVGAFLIWQVRAECTRILRRKLRTAPLVESLPAPTLPELPHDISGALADCIDSLPEAQRTVLLLDADELTYAAIAEAMKLPVSTIRNRLFAARKSLRVCLEAKGYKP